MKKNIIYLSFCLSLLASISIFAMEGDDDFFNKRPEVDAEEQEAPVSFYRKNKTCTTQ